MLTKIKKLIEKVKEYLYIKKTRKIAARNWKYEEEAEKRNNQF